jgi:hypothetical protein
VTLPLPCVDFITEFGAICSVIPFVVPGLVNENDRRNVRKSRTFLKAADMVADETARLMGEIQETGQVIPLKA